MAAKQKAETAGKSSTDKVLDALDKIINAAKKRELTTAGIVTAVFGGVLNLTKVTVTFPSPFSMLGNFIIFVAVLMIAVDVCRGGLMD